MKQNLLLILFSFLSYGSICAESMYLPPQPVKVMFHVDKLPIDKGMRQQLSGSLTTLAKRKHDGSAEEHRLTAQLLMLAMRLDRENTSATELNGNLAKGGALPKTDNESQEKALSKLRSAKEALSKIHKQSEAHVLEAYLHDVLIALEKSNPLATRLEAHIKRWEGVVPVVNKESVIVMPDIVSEEGDKLGDKENKQPLPGEAEDKLNQNLPRPEFTRWKMHKSSIKLPLVFYTMIEDRVEYNEEMADLSTQIFPRVNLDSNLILELKPWADEDQIANFKEKIDPLMKAQFEKYESVKVEITTNGRLSKKNLSRMMFPLFLQLKASERNIQINPGLLTLGVLSRNNSITRNSDFWHLLKYIRQDKGTGRRLLIPIGAAADLKQLIAYQEEDFFVRNEVLIVSNIDEALDSVAESRNSDINAAAAEFAKIQQMIGDKSIGPFAVNPKIKAQLEGILAKNPNHFSAKMILLRGNVSRPKKLDSFFIADELSVVLNRASYLNEKKENEISGSHTDKIAKEIRKTIQELEPLLDSKDRKLITYLNDIAIIMETIARAKDRQRQDEREGKRESKSLQKTITEGLAAFIPKYKEAKTQLDLVMSELPKVE